MSNLSEAISNGIRVSQFAAGQAQDMAKTGDYSPAIRAIGFVIETVNERWQAMPLEKRTEKGSEFIADLGIGSIFGAGHELAKSGKLIDALETIAEQLKDFSGPGKEKAKQALGAFLEDVLQPKGLATNGIEMPIPKDMSGTPKDRFDRLESPGKGDNYFAMSSEAEGTVFRGDHDLRSRFNTKGQRKSFLNERGDLEPADCSGLYKGRPVEIFEHVLGNKYSKIKQSSPYTSFGTSDGVVAKYGDTKLELDLPRLREAIKNGELRDVSIVEHEQVVEAIENSNLKPFPKKMALCFVRADREMLVRGTIPGRFLKYE